MRSLVDVGRRWRGHALKIVDGSTLSMPDEPPLQEKFPQPDGQKAGCGFPIARVVGVFCWATGALIGLAVGSLRVAEVTLLRLHWDSWLLAGDVMIADRHFCSYVDLARLQERGVFVILRQHHRREVDFRKGQRLGEDDQLVDWSRPRRRLDSFCIDAQAFAKLPETLRVRQIRVSHVPKGFRSQTVVIVTTLLDPILYPADEIRELYRDRWMAELHIRSLKTYLGMDLLRGQSYDIILKEIAVHVLAYNLIRLLMWHAARGCGRDLHRLSFTGTLHRLRNTAPLLLMLPLAQAELLASQFLAWIGCDLVPLRPDRFEPRRRKRRPKEYSLLTMPRRWYHAHGDHGAR
jgi:hypothetical protein